MPSSGFSVVISASDKTASVIEGINRRLEKMQAPAQRVQKALDKFGDVSGLNSVSKGISKVGDSALSAARSVTRVIEPLAAITSVASVAGVYRLVTAWGQFGSTLGNSATRIGVSASNLYALQGAAGAAGASADALTASMEGLSKTVYDAIGGRNVNAVNLFNQLGIAFTDSSRRALPLVGVLKKIADQVKEQVDNGNPQGALRIMDAFGQDPALFPLLAKGGAAIEQYIAKAKTYGDMTQKQIKDANDLRESQFWLGRSVEGTTNQISAAVGPAVTPLINDLSKYILDHRSGINAFANEKATEFKKWVEGGGLTRFENDLDGIGKRADAVAQYFGGWKNVAEDIVLLMTTRFAIAFLTPFAQVGLGVLKLIASMRALRAASLGAAAAEALATGGAGPATAGIGLGGWASLGIPLLLSGDTTSPDTYTPAQRSVADALEASELAAYGKTHSLFTPNSAAQSATEKALYAEAIRLGQTPAQAAAWLSQAKRESSYNPAAENAGHYGLFQWDSERQANFLKYAGHSIVGSSATEQLDFAVHEMRNTYPKARSLLDLYRNDAPNAALALQNNFEMTDNPLTEGVKSSALAADIMARIPAIARPALPGSPGAPGAAGKVDVVIHPPDSKTKVSAKSSGNVNRPKIAHPMPGNDWS